MTALALLALAGCQFAGGGIMQSEQGPSHPHAVFSFNLNCPNKGLTTGVLTYSDPAAGVLIRATPTGSQGLGCGGNPFNSNIDFSGTYTTITGAPGTGNFSLTIVPSTSTPPAGTTFSLRLTTGPRAGYSNSGPVVAGQIRRIG